MRDCIRNRCHIYSLFWASTKWDEPAVPEFDCIMELDVEYEFPELEEEPV